MFDWAWCVLQRACELLNHVSFMSLAWFCKRWNEYWFLVLNFFNHSWLSFPLFETSCDILGQSHKKGTIYQLGRMNNFWTLMDSIVSIFNNLILSIWNLLTWELILCFLPTRTHAHTHTQIAHMKRVMNMFINLIVLSCYICICIYISNHLIVYFINIQYTFVKYLTKFVWKENILFWWIHISNIRKACLRDHKKHV